VAKIASGSGSEVLEQVFDPFRIAHLHCDSGNQRVTARSFRFGFNFRKEKTEAAVARQMPPAQFQCLAHPIHLSDAGAKTHWREVEQYHNVPRLNGFNPVTRASK
jgi:hypothetical protein